MKDWACADGADKAAMAATAAANSFAVMSDVSLKFAGKVDRPTAKSTHDIGQQTRPRRGPCHAPKVGAGTSCHASPIQPQCAANSGGRHRLPGETWLQTTHPPALRRP